MYLTVVEDSANFSNCCYCHEWCCTQYGSVVFLTRGQDLDDAEGQWKQDLGLEDIE